MYEMGGLIKKMPLSFISVLIMIIAVSGVPPLSGFGAKWLIYSSFIEKGWYLQAGVLFFASGVSFLYLYRIIHTIFLGQLKYLSREYYAQIFLLRFGHHPTYFTVGAVVGLGYGIMELYRVSLILKKSGGRGKVVFYRGGALTEYGENNGKGDKPK